MVCLKFLSFVSLMFFFVIHHQLVEWVIRDEKKRLHYFLGSIQWYARMGLKILGGRVDAFDSTVAKGQLLVSNHLSYVDILVLFSHYPSLFITSVEIKETFFLGRITRLAGCFFVERRKSKRTNSTIISEMASIRRKLTDGFNIFLFPEGTSSCGKEVLTFKATFFQTAVDAETAVLPLCLRYSRPEVPWYGDMNFPGHLWKLCSLGGFQAQLRELTVIQVSEGRDRFAMRDLSYERIRQCYAEN